MPRRDDIHNILIIGSGPIVIGQGCEFDYSGVQACRALKEEGYRIVLVNSNPATIMTDPEFADATYIEPITADAVEAHRRALPAMPLFTYPAGHAFNRDVDPKAWHRPSAELARERSLAFLAEHLA